MVTFKDFLFLNVLTDLVYCTYCEKYIQRKDKDSWADYSRKVYRHVKDTKHHEDCNNPDLQAETLKKAMETRNPGGLPSIQALCSLPTDTLYYGLEPVVGMQSTICIEEDCNKCFVNTPKFMSGLKDHCKSKHAGKDFTIAPCTVQKIFDNKNITLKLDENHRVQAVSELVKFHDLLALPETEAIEISENPLSDLRNRTAVSGSQNTNK